jgi:hypothetical protein
VSAKKPPTVAVPSSACHRMHDGYDDWRERLFAAGVPIPSKETLVRLEVAQLATGADVIGAVITLHRQQSGGGK